MRGHLGGLGLARWLVVGTVACADPAVIIDGPRPGGDGGAGGADGGPGGADGGAGGADAAPVAGAPEVASHALAFNVFGALSPDPLRTTARAVEAGSTVLVMVAKGTAAGIAAPTDSLGQGFTQLGPTETYVNWPSSGNALFHHAASAASAQYQVAETMVADRFDECTLSMVVVRGTTGVVDVAASETPSRGPVTSGSVTTTGPALLVAYWWGDSVVAQQTATPSAGFTVLHSLLVAQPIVQVAVAVKQVAAAGTYDVTWSATPDQGAITWLVALQ